MADLNRIQKIIRVHMREQKMSQMAFCRGANIYRATLIRILSCYGLPGIENAIRISKFMGVRCEWLFGEDILGPETLSEKFLHDRVALEGV